MLDSKTENAHSARKSIATRSGHKKSQHKFLNCDKIRYIL